VAPRCERLRLARAERRAGLRQLPARRQRLLLLLLLLLLMLLEELKRLQLLHQLVHRGLRLRLRLQRRPLLLLLGVVVLVKLLQQVVCCSL
jgi:hypothetical protein